MLNYLRLPIKLLLPQWMTRSFVQQPKPQVPMKKFRFTCQMRVFDCEASTFKDAMKLFIIWKKENNLK